MIEAHPLADELPLIEGQEFDELVKSIKEEGLIDDIVLCDGKILDGRNRYRACLKAGVEPRFSMFESDDPAEQARYVMVKNLTRRHLKDAQRAVIAGRLIALQGIREEAAVKMMNVGDRTARKAATVIRKGDSNVIELMNRGDLSVHAAHTAVTATPGRPIGKASVAKIRRLLVELKALMPKSSEIVEFWPGDPGLNIDLAQCSQFLASLTKATREPDHASSVA